VKSNGRYGFIDKTGKLAVPAKYNGALDFSGSLAEVFSIDDPVSVITASDPTQYLLGFITPDGTEYFDP
jgi:hypothetical protein